MAHGGPGPHLRPKKPRPHLASLHPFPPCAWRWSKGLCQLPGRREWVRHRCRTAFRQTGRYLATVTSGALKLSRQSCRASREEEHRPPPSCTPPRAGPRAPAWSLITLPPSLLPHTGGRRPPRPPAPGLPTSKGRRVPLPRPKVKNPKLRLLRNPQPHGPLRTLHQSRP